MKKVIAILLVACFVGLLMGCTSKEDNPLNVLLGENSNSQSDSFQNSSSSQDISTSDSASHSSGGYYDGRIGDTLKNAFFEYTVLSANYVNEYDGYRPTDGNVLLDTVIRVKNVFGETIPMFNADFQIQWGDGDEDYGYGVEALEGKKDIMPQEYELARAETVTYHVVYEVPEGTSEYSISYLEIYEDNSQGDVFFVYFEL